MASQAVPADRTSMPNWRCDSSPILCGVPKMLRVLQYYYWPHVISRLGGEAKEWVDLLRRPTFSAVFLVKQSHRLHWAGPSIRA